MIRAEEEHARYLLSDHVGVEFRFNDDGSKAKMPDLVSADRLHVAEVVTTVRSAVREAEQRLDPMAEPWLPHCVWVVIPYARLGGVIRGVRHKIKADVFRWITEAGCEYHWALRDEWQLRAGINPDPILSLGAYDDGIRATCAQRCHHSDGEPHRIRWVVAHEPSPDNPWELIRRSLRNVDKEQRGGVQALAAKLDGYSHKHLVIYPFGPPGNLAAALNQYVFPVNLRDLMPPRLNTPLADIHLWLPYKYGNRGVEEGLHVCDGHWARFGMALPSVDLPVPFSRFHYGDA